MVPVRGAPEKSVDPRNEFPKIEGFGKIIVGTLFSPSTLSSTVSRAVRRRTGVSFPWALTVSST
jgi:hypothetical protein